MISRVGVSLATASAMLTCDSIPIRIAVRCSGVASPLKLLWMDAGVSGSGAAKTGCWMSRCSCAYVVTCRSLVISLTVSISCAVQLGDVWMYIVSELVVLLVPFWFPFQKSAVLICSVSLFIVILFSRPGMFSSLDMMRSGAVLYCRCLDMTVV